MTEKEFEKLVEKAIKELPAVFREKMQNVAVTVVSSPTRAQLRRFGGDLLGLYEGIPLSERGQSYSGAMPDKIIIFRSNIEKICATEEEITREVRNVVMHEIAHHFGIDDERLREEGIY